MIQIVKNSIDYIENHLTEKIKIEDISKEVNCSVRTLQRLFKTICKYDISEYILNRKLSLIINELDNTNLSILDIALKYGYQNAESLSRIFKKIFSISPSQYRKEKIDIEKFEKMDTSKMYDIKKYNLIDYYNEKKDSMTLYGIRKKVIKGENNTLYENEINFYKLLKRKEVFVDKIYEICYENNQETNYSKGIFVENNIENLSKEISCINIPATNWLVCKGKSKVSYEEAKILTMYLMQSKICNEIYNEFGYYQDLEFSEENEIINICINKGFDNRNQEYHCEIWIPIKEDFFIEANCTTCADCIVCDNYDKTPIEKRLEKFPKGCPDFKYSLADYILNEEIRKEKTIEIFKDRFVYKLLVL